MRVPKDAISRRRTADLVLVGFMTLSLGVAIGRIWEASAAPVASGAPVVHTGEPSHASAKWDDDAVDRMVKDVTHQLDQHETRLNIQSKTISELMEKEKKPCP